MAAPLLLILIKKTKLKEKPSHTKIQSSCQSCDETQRTNYRSLHFGAYPITSKNLFTILIEPLGFIRDLVFEDDAEDLASETVGQPGVLDDS